MPSTDGRYRKMRAMQWNPGECENFAAHIENAIDRAFPNGEIDSFTLSQEWVHIQNDAILEFDNCEGH